MVLTWLMRHQFYSKDKELSSASLVRYRMRVEMAKVLTLEEPARSILTAFKASEARTDQVLMLATVDRS
jgi:hypothetical protein